MLLIIELCLTIWAWRKGWKSKALIPIGAFFGIAFCVGVVIGAVNGNVETIGPWFILLDFGAIGVLIHMIAKPPVVKEVVKKDETFKFE